MEFYLSITQKIVGLAIIFQSIEFLKIRELFADQGIWQLDIIKKDFSFLPLPFKKTLEIFLDYKVFLFFILLRLLLAGSLFFQLNLYSLLILIFISFLISVRFRGPFNGGSDYMTVVLLTGLAIATQNAHWGLWYIALQSTISYVLAGVVKVKFKKWWDGRALIEFFSSPFYKLPSFMMALTKSQAFAALASITVLIFELSFPISLIYRPAVYLYIIFGFGFHFTIFMGYGLNRFLWAWTATYPALIYCSENYWTQM